MGMSWTKEQQQVIRLRDRNILVSAAAGSGKTAVLVERIIQRITEKEHPVDIDRMLIVTFTNAAAAEMRERIGTAIEKALEENPYDAHLQRQLTLIHNAQITTIDSFCLYVIRNHFHEIDLEPNFRIGDEGELKLLKEDVIKRVLEEHYSSLTPAFEAFMEGYASGRSDEAAVSMILQLYEFSRSYPWPGKWLDSCRESYEITDVAGLDAAEWIKPLVKNIRCILQDITGLMEEALALTLDGDGPYMYEKAIRSDLEKYKALSGITEFSGFYRELTNISYDRFGSSRGFEGSVEKQERVKKLRDTAKEAVKKLNRQYFFCSPEQMVEQVQNTKEMAAELVVLTKDFSAAFAEEKRRKNLVDFHDLEHFALEILVEEATGAAKKTAEEFRDTFEEIMIDEYQDSNNVQEAILTAISRESRGENNIFMVGDVKQSIYRFRLARPELFMEKYNSYQTEDCDRQRIDLNKNFRSREEVLSCTNDIFYRIMGMDLGNVAYDENAALKPGADYPSPTAGSDAQPERSDADCASGAVSQEGDNPFAAELLLCDSSEELLADSGYQDKKLLEAKLVVSRIKRLMKEQLVTDKESRQLRRVRYSDIVILLRSLSGWADSFAAALNDAGIPAHTVSSSGYFSAVEVQTVLSMLRILDNPRQDIPLAAVLRSPIAGITDEELAALRLTGPAVPFHECILNLCAALEEKEPETPAERKLYEFYKKYKKLRRIVPDTPIHELLESLLKETGYGSYVAAMPAGSRRGAKIEMLIEKAIAYENTSYKGLFHFVRYIDELQKYEVDFGEADMIGENEDVVRIMSIHKSKGLEFPVVFVSGLGKSFNKQDVRSRMVLHPELGIGLDYMDGRRRIKSPTIVKRAVAKQIELENLGEELRVLYVALTRAKEKLILTGNLKDAKEVLTQKQADAWTEAEAELFSEQITGVETRAESVERQEKRLLPYLTREGAATYLDWILPAVFSYGEKYQPQVMEAGELVVEEVETQIRGQLEKEERLAAVWQADSGLFDDIGRRFEQKYPHCTDITRKNKYSVSELKHRAMQKVYQQEDQETAVLFPEEEIIPYVPKFIREMEEGTDEEEINRGALRGTAVHRVMECYAFASDAAPKQQIAEMLEKGLITEEMQQLVKLPLVEKFAASEVGSRMKRAEACGRLCREKPFVMGFTGKELASFGFSEEQPEEGMEETEKLQAVQAEEDLTLIQGIIDVFWLEEDGIVLLDYKTDRVKCGEELKQRYQAQLELYAEALNRVFSEQKLRVKEKLLYSFRLGEVIPV